MFWGWTFSKKVQNKILKYDSATKGTVFLSVLPPAESFCPPSLNCSCSGDFKPKSAPTGFVASAQIASKAANIEQWKCW